MPLDLLATKRLALAAILAGLWLVLGALAMAFTTEGAVFFYLGAFLVCLGTGLILFAGLRALGRRLRGLRAP